MIDKNTKEFRVTDGYVTGIKLEIITPPSYQYEVDILTLINERDSRGKTIATCYVDGREHRCYLGYPLSREGNFQNILNPNDKNEHIITNGFDPLNTLGPLSIFVGDNNKRCISQIITGFGLPLGHHVCFVVGFKKVSVIKPPIEDTEELVTLRNRVKFLEGKIDMIIKEFEQWKGDL